MTGAAAGDFAGKVALVTGAASGVGRATAEALAARGAAVACLDRRGEEVEALAAGIASAGDGAETVGSEIASAGDGAETVASAGGGAEALAAGIASAGDEVEALGSEIAPAGGEAIGVQCDLRDPAAIEAALARALEWRPRLDVLAHVAGLGLRRRAEDTTSADWDRVIEVNLRAPFLLTRAATDALVESQGAVVAVSSLAGLAGWPYSTAYAASKGGLTTMMRSFALELGPRGVRVNVVCPGGIDSPMLDDLDEIADPDPASAKRGRGLDDTLASPVEVAAAICFLASPAASHVNGTTLTVDGGATA